jgi:hypothetical protein
MSLHLTRSETTTDRTAQGGASITGTKTIPVQVSGAFWKGVFVATPLGLTFWLTIVWLLS